MEPGVFHNLSLQHGPVIIKKLEEYVRYVGFRFSFDYILVVGD